VTSSPLRKTLRCPSAGITRIAVLMGNRNDTVDLTGGEKGKPPAPGASYQNVATAARITGGPGNDQLTAGEGADTVSGGGGVNIARGVGGNDRLLMRNGVRDTLIDCGAGIDTAVVDKIDPRPIACETVLRPR
jgi:Ca2+-binding RTX toxin-like protein